MARRQQAADRAPLRVEVTCHTRRPVRATGLAAWLTRTAPAKLGGEVSVALVSDARVRALNRDYRGLDYATDVLSFPSGDAGIHDHKAGRPDRPFLGDIVIAVGVATRQAAAAGHALGTELRVLALHGLLHLAGYDHEQDQGEMAKAETRLRVRGGLRNGLLERARGRRRQTSSSDASAGIGPGPISKRSRS